MSFLILHYTYQVSNLYILSPKMGENPNSPLSQQAEIHLDQIRSRPNGFPESGQCVFRRFCRSASMSYNKHNNKFQIANLK